MIIHRVIFVTQVFCLLYTYTNADTLYITEGSNTTLICPFKSTTHKAQWLGPKSLTAYSDGSYLKNTLTNYEKLRITGNYRIGEYNLEINNFSPDDEGHYRCNTINGSTVVHVDYYLEIYRSPKNISVTNTSSDGLLEVNEGQISLLTCTVESGNPAEDMMWVHNDSILVFGGPKCLVYEFVPVVTDHLQVYICIANNSKTEDTVEYQVQLYVKELPNTTIQPAGSTVIEAAEGKDIVLNCEYQTNVKPYKMTWIFNNDTILSESSDEVTLKGTLHLTNLSRNNTGTYRCNVYNTVGMGNAEIDVLITYIRVLVSPRRYNCSTGNSTSINCFVNTNLYTEWSCVWKHFYNDEFIRSLPCIVKDGVSRLRFEFCNYMDTGIYKCILETPTWNFSSNAELSVKGPPIVLTSVVERHSNNILISTYFVSYSTAKSISWFFNNGKKESQIESNSTKFQILSSKSAADIAIYGKKVHIDCMRTDLKLLDSQRVKEGWFVCLIRNRFGSRETVFNVTHNSTFKTFLGESLTTTDSHTEAIFYSSMYPLNSSEVNDEVIDPAKDNSTVIFLIGGLTLFVALTLAGAMWQYTAFLKGTTTIQTEIQMSNDIALQNVRRSTPSDDIYEEICNENADACPPSISGQVLEEEIDDKRLTIAGETISTPNTNIYEDLDDAPKERNQNNSDHYKTISSEMPILDHNSDDENYLIPGPAYLIVIDSDQEKEANPCDTNAYKLII